MSASGVGGSANALTITVLDADLDADEDADPEFKAQFNPGEFSVEKSVTYAEQEIPGLDSPIQQFTSGGAETLSVELFFDVYEERGDDQPDDVRELTDSLNRLLLVDGDRHAPPVVKFAWGTITFIGVVERSNTTFTLFAGDGVPVRARVDLSLREHTPPSKQLEGTPRHSADRRSVRTVREGDTLPGIAGDEYGRPGEWRLIATANGIDDPRRLIPGDEIVIPVLERT